MIEIVIFIVCIMYMYVFVVYVWLYWLLWWVSLYKGVFLFNWGGGGGFLIKEKKISNDLL